MKIHYLSRRIHLYLGLFLFLFFIKYAVSAIPFAHNQMFNKYYKDKPQWEVTSEQEYTRPVPEGADLQELGEQILADFGDNGTFWVNRNNNRLNINRYSFWSTTRYTYKIDENMMVVESQHFRWDHFITKFHWIGGYQQNRFINDLWAFMIDLVCIGIFVWIATGIYMWWKIKSARFWGSVALGGGMLTFIIFLIVL
ncbi:hypothetical protein ACFL6P_07535 [Candidatus Latescibacterota bacterium]